MGNISGYSVQLWVVVDKSGQISAKLLSRWLYTHTVTTWGYFDCYPKGVNLDKKWNLIMTFMRIGALIIY
jgi:hypothetical protein